MGAPVIVRRLVRRSPAPSAHRPQTLAFPEPVLRQLPRPSRLVPRPTQFIPIPKREREIFRASIFRTLVRLLWWTYPVAYYLFFRIVDTVRGRNTPIQRAQRVRQALERMGGTFVKLGQQMSTRLDLLSPELCYELSRLLDDMEPFPTEEAIRAIERTTGKPLADTFSAFDPKPLGSGSVACVYHGVLRTGEEVAVKVRRPGIGEVFAADLNALDLLCRTAEILSILRPGFTAALRTELRTMFLEELNFRSEARYQDLFRRKAKADRQKYITAPKVYFKYSGHDVLVSEYVTGVWVGDLIAAKELNDRKALDYCASLNIHPKKVARRLIRARHWSVHETLFYHGDPHPSNIVVKPNSNLVLIDFGACGPTTHKSRRDHLELFRRQAGNDVDGMVEVFNNMLAPLPHLDLHGFTKAGEAQVREWTYAFESPSSEWWEHTSANMWIRLFEATREFSIPVNIETIRLMRSSLLYDTVAARLYDKINAQKEFVAYEREARRRALERLLDRLADAWSPGRAALEAERLFDLGRRLLYKLEQFADQPTVPFLAAISKASFVASAFLRLVLIATVLTAGAAFGVSAWNRLQGIEADALQVVNGVFASGWYWLAVVLLLVRFYRVVQFKLNDIDRQNQTVFASGDPLS